MKKWLFIALAMFALNAADAQIFKYGLRLGGATSSIDADPQTIIKENGVDSITLAITNTKFGIHAGIFARVKIGPVYVQPELLFNTASYEYTKADFSSGSAVTEILEDNFNTLDIPIMVGAKFSAFRVQFGPIGSILISNNNQLEALTETFNRELTNLTWGWQAGVGLDISKFVIDIKYEGSFQRFGESVNFYGNEYNFDGRVNRFIVTLGYTF